MKERQASAVRGVVETPPHPHNQQPNQQKHKRKKKKSQQQAVISDNGGPHISGHYPATPPSAASSHEQTSPSGSHGGGSYHGHSYSHSHEQSNSQLFSCNEYRHDQSNSQLSSCREYRHDQSNSQLPPFHACCEEVPGYHGAIDGRGSYSSGRIISTTPSSSLVIGGSSGVGARHSGLEGGHHAENGAMYDGRSTSQAGAVETGVMVGTGSRMMMMAEGASFISPSRSELQLKRASWSAFPPNYDAATGYHSSLLPQNQHFSRTDFLATDATSRERNLQNMYKSQSIENLDTNKSVSTENLKKSKKKSGFGSIRFTPAFLRGSANSIKELFAGIGSNSSGSKSQSKFSIDSLDCLPGNAQPLQNDTQNLPGSRRHSFGNYLHLNSSNNGSVTNNPTQQQGVNQWEQHSVSRRLSYTSGGGSESSVRDFKQSDSRFGNGSPHTSMDVGSSRDCEPVPLEGPCQVCGMDVSLHSTIGCRRLRGSNMSVGARRWTNDASSAGGGSCRNSGVFTVPEEDEGDCTLDRSRELLQKTSRDTGAGRPGGSAASTPSVKILHAHLKQESSRSYDQRYPINHGDPFASVASVGAPRHQMHQSQSIPYSLAAVPQHTSYSSSVPHSEMLMSSSFDSRSGMKVVSRELILNRQSSVPYGNVGNEAPSHSGYSASSLLPSIRDRSNSVDARHADHPLLVEEFIRPERSFRELETSLEYANRCFRDNSNGSNDEACCEDVNMSGAGGKAGTTGGKENVVPNNTRAATKSNSFKHNFRFMNGKSFFPKLDSGKKKAGKLSKGKTSYKKAVNGASKSNSASPKTKPSTNLSAPGVVEENESDSSSDGRSLASFVSDIKRRSLRVTAAADFIRTPTRGPKFLRSSLRSSSKSASYSVKSNLSAPQSLNQSSHSVVSNSASFTKLDTSFSYLAFNKRRLNKLTSSSRSTQSAPPCPPSPPKNPHATTWTCECCDQMCVECSGGLPEETICQLPGCCPPASGFHQQEDKHVRLESSNMQLPQEGSEQPLEADKDLEAAIPSGRMSRLAPGYDRSLKKYKKNKRFKKVRKAHHEQSNKTDEQDADTLLTTQQSMSSLQSRTEDGRNQLSTSSSTRHGDIRSSEFDDSLNVTRNQSLNDSVFVDEESAVVLRHDPRTEGLSSTQGPVSYHAGAYGNTHPPFSNIQQDQSRFNPPPRALSYGQVPYFQVSHHNSANLINNNKNDEASVSTNRDAPSSTDARRLKPLTSLWVGLPAIPPSPSPSIATYASPSMFRDLASAGGNKVCLSRDYASPLDKRAPMQFPSKADPDLESPMYTCPVVFALDDADQLETNDTVQGPVASGSYEKSRSEQRAKKPNGGNFFFPSTNHNSVRGSTQSLSVCSKTSSVERRVASGPSRDGDLNERHSVISSGSSGNAFREPCDPDLREPFSLNHRSVSCQSVNRSSSSSCQSLAMSAVRAASSSSSLSVASCHSRNTRLSSDASSLARLNNEQKRTRAAKVGSSLLETFNGRRGDEATVVEPSRTSEPFYENFGNFTINRLFFQSEFEEYKIEMSETSFESKTDTENSDAPGPQKKELHKAISAKAEIDRTLYSFFPVPNKKNFPGRNRITSADASDDSFYFTDVDADQNDISAERASIHINSSKPKTDSRPDSRLAFEALFPRIKDPEQPRKVSTNSVSLGSNKKNHLNRRAASCENAAQEGSTNSGSLDSNSKSSFNRAAAASYDRRQLPPLKNSGLSFEAELEAQLEQCGSRRNAELRDDQMLDVIGSQTRQSSNAGQQQSSRSHVPSSTPTHDFSTPPPLPPPLPRRVLDSVLTYSSSIPYPDQFVPSSYCAQASSGCALSAPPTPCSAPPPPTFTPSTLPYTNNHSNMNVIRFTDSNRSTHSSASCHSTKSQPAHSSHSRITQSSIGCSTGSWGPTGHRSHSNPLFVASSEEASRHRHPSLSIKVRDSQQHLGNSAGSITAFPEPLGSSTLKPPSSEYSSEGTIGRFMRGVDQVSLESISDTTRHSRSSFNPEESSCNSKGGSHASLALSTSLGAAGSSLDRQHPRTTANINRSQSSMVSPSSSVTGLSALFNSNLSLQSLSTKTSQHSGQSSPHHNPSLIHLPNRTSSFLSHSVSSSSSSTATTSLHRPSSSSERVSSSDSAALSPCSALSSSVFQDSPRPSNSSRDGSCCCRDCCSSPDNKSNAAVTLSCDSTLPMSATTSTINNANSPHIATHAMADADALYPGDAVVPPLLPCAPFFMLGKDIINVANIERLGQALRSLKASDCQLMVQLINLHSQIQEMSGHPFASPPPSPPPCLRSPLRAALASAAPSSQYFRRGVPPTCKSGSTSSATARPHSFNGSSSPLVAGLETAPSTPVMDEVDTATGNFNTYANIDTVTPPFYPGGSRPSSNMDDAFDSVEIERQSTNEIPIVSVEPKDVRFRSSSLSVVTRSNPCPNPLISFSDRGAPSGHYESASGHRQGFRTPASSTSCGSFSSAAVAGSAPCPAPCPAHLRDEVVSALLHRQRLQRGPDGKLQDGSGLVTVL